MHIDTSSSASESTASSLWFTDGNLIIVAEPSGVHFKIHRGMLERHSEVFRDLFTLATPDSDRLTDKSGDGDEHGCASIQVYDRPKDWTCLLHALYDGL